MPHRIRLRQPTNITNGTVIREPLGSPIAPFGDFIFSYASVADDLPAWGTSIMGRDRALRQFWPTEPMTASAVFSVCSKYAGFEWALEGPPRTVGIYQDMLNTVEGGTGWVPMMMKILSDLVTQDNGAFAEIVRVSDDPMSPCITLNHLDANRCIRTGHRDTPVVYYDLQNGAHLMKWYQIVHLAEMPSPIEYLRGIQLCAISRMLRAAQIMRDISVYKREKISGRFNRGIYLVSGVQQRSIDQMLTNQQHDADAVGLTRYVQPIIIASLDPGATVKVDSIEFAKLPDNFNEEEAMKWYVAQLALAFGGDYQDFAPLPGGNLGSGQQSRMLHQKALGKGSRLFMKLMEQIMNYRGILPNNVRFSYRETDSGEDSSRADMKLTRAKERQIRILSGEITPAVARQIAVDDGDLEYEYMYQMNEAPLTSDVSLSQDDPFAASPEVADVGNPDVYEGTPEDQIIPNMHGTFGAAPTGVPTSSNTASPAKPAAQGTEKPGATKELTEEQYNEIAASIGVPTFQEAKLLLATALNVISKSNGNGTIKVPTSQPNQRPGAKALTDRPLLPIDTRMPNLRGGPPDYVRVMGTGKPKRIRKPASVAVEGAVYPP